MSSFEAKLSFYSTKSADSKFFLSLFIGMGCHRMFMLANKFIFRNPYEQKKKTFSCVWKSRQMTLWTKYIIFHAHCFFFFSRHSKCSNCLPFILKKGEQNFCATSTSIYLQRVKFRKGDLSETRRKQCSNSQFAMCKVFASTEKTRIHYHHIKFIVSQFSLLSQAVSASFIYLSKRRKMFWYKKNTLRVQSVNETFSFKIQPIN